MEPKEVTDDTKLWFGKHRGIKLRDVSADYLLWLYDQDWIDTRYPKLFDYIDDNMVVLDIEMKENGLTGNSRNDW